MNTSNEKRVTDKPPKPFRPLVQSIEPVVEIDRLVLAPSTSDNENDVSTHSVHINPDEMKQFDMTFEDDYDDVNDTDDDDDDENGCNAASDKENKSVSWKPEVKCTKPNLFVGTSISSSHFNDLTNVSQANFFDLAEITSNLVLSFFFYILKLYFMFK